MNIKDLKVGDKVFIREDLDDWEIFGTLIYYPNMQTGVVKVTHISRDYFKVQDGIGYLYSAEMVDWEKTIKLRREKMNIKDLKVGDKVYIKSGMQHSTKYGSQIYVDAMGSGVRQVKNIYSDKSFTVIGGIGYLYTPEMVDWEKTMSLKLIPAKEYLNEKFGDNTARNPSHYGGGGKYNIECYKAIEYILDSLENVPEKYYGHVSNIVKYVWRCNDKNGYEDLDKASVYFDFMFREED